MIASGSRQNWNYVDHISKTLYLIKNYFIQVIKKKKLQWGLDSQPAERQQAVTITLKPEYELQMWMGHTKCFQRSSVIRDWF